MPAAQGEAKAAAQAAVDANKALLAALDSRQIPTIRKAMKDYADKVQGVRLQSAAFELLSRVSKANDEELNQLIAEMHLLATTRMETRMERQASMDLPHQATVVLPVGIRRGSNASLGPPPPLAPKASLPPAPPMPPPRPPAPARKASLRGATHTNTADIRKELEQQKNKLRKVGARRRSLPIDLNNALLQGPAAVRARLRHVEARERPSIHPGMRLHGAELRHVGRDSEEDVSEEDGEEVAEPPRMSRTRSSRNEVGVAGQEPAAAAPLLKQRSSTKSAAAPLLTKRSSSARAAAAQIKGSSYRSHADEDMDKDANEVAPAATAAPALKKQRSSTLGLTGAMAGLRTSRRGSSIDAVAVQVEPAAAAVPPLKKRNSSASAAAATPLARRTSSRSQAGAMASNPDLT